MNTRTTDAPRTAADSAAARNTRQPTRTSTRRCDAWTVSNFYSKPHRCEKAVNVLPVDLPQGKRALCTHHRIVAERDASRLTFSA